MSIVTQQIKSDREYKSVISNVLQQLSSDRPYPMSVTGLGEGAAEVFYAELISDVKANTNNGCLLICPDEKAEQRLKNTFESLGMKALIYPYRDFVFHNITASHEFEHDRLNVLQAIIQGDYDVVLATPDAALQYTVPKDYLVQAVFEIDSKKNMRLRIL